MHCAVEERFDVHAGDGCGHHSEIRQSRISAADIRRIDEDLAELVARGIASELCLGIGNSDEVLSGTIAFDRLYAIVEVAVKHRRLGGGA